MPAERDAAVADLAVERLRKHEAAKVAENATHHDLALAWCEARAIGEARPVYTNGAFYVPTPTGLWRSKTHEQVQVEVARMFNGRKLCRKNSDFKQLADHIASLCEVEGFFDAAPMGVVTPAGFHELASTGAVETAPLSLDHRQTFALDYRPEFEADAPLLVGVLESAFEGDDAKAQIDLFWQIVGAALFGLMPKLQVVALFLGRERSGKSLLQRVLELIFPPIAVGAVSPANWGHEYHVATLAGKRLNVVGELADDAPIPASSFKNVTGQNLVGARHPTHRPFSFRCQAAHVFASNVLPPTTDRSEAFYRRWRVLRFANTVPAEKVDPDLCDKIVANEMPAILAEAFLGAERVARAGRMRTTAAHESVLERWRHAANPLEQFLADDEWVEVDPGCKEHRTEEVYAAYRRWAALAGFRNPFGRNHFLDLLDSTGAGRGVLIKRIGSKNVVVGLRLLRAASAE
jgi:P4 family phage/plasmid primase-like protien